MDNDPNERFLPSRNLHNARYFTSAMINRQYRVPAFPPLPENLNPFQSGRPQAPEVDSHPSSSGKETGSSNELSSHAPPVVILPTPRFSQESIRPYQNPVNLNQHQTHPQNSRSFLGAPSVPNMRGHIIRSGSLLGVGNLFGKVDNGQIPTPKFPDFPVPWGEAQGGRRILSKDHTFREAYVAYAEREAQAKRDELNMSGETDGSVKREIEGNGVDNMTPVQKKLRTEAAAERHGSAFQEHPTAVVTPLLTTVNHNTGTQTIENRNIERATAAMQTMAFCNIEVQMSGPENIKAQNSAAPTVAANIVPAQIPVVSLMPVPTHTGQSTTFQKTEDRTAAVQTIVKQAICGQTLLGKDTTPPESRNFDADISVEQQPTWKNWRKMLDIYVNGGEETNRIPYKDLSKEEKQAVDIPDRFREWLVKIGEVHTKLGAKRFTDTVGYRFFGRIKKERSLIEVITRCSAVMDMIKQGREICESSAECSCLIDAQVTKRHNLRVVEDNSPNLERDTGK